MTPTRRIPRIVTPPKQNGAERWTPLTTDAVRWSKILSAQARIATGYYDRDEVREALIDEVLRELQRR
jgi:hypothetical protein